jgi:hypothetical protein
VAGTGLTARGEADLQESPLIETEHADLRTLRKRPHNQIHVTGIVGLRQVGDRRLGFRMRVRVVEPDDVKAALPRRTPCIDVVLGIQAVPVGVLREIAGPDGFDDFAVSAQQHAAALGGQGLARVSGNRVDHVACEPEAYNASTAIAMPMPPPMHNAATPYRSFLARSA